MPGDLTRTSDDVRQQYRGLVFQQGRVTVDRDYNALQEIIGDRIKEETLDVIGPAGTPDDGFRISLPSSGMSPPGSPPLASPPNPAEWDFLISPGTMYLGGERAVFRAPSASDPPISYDNQPDWLAPDPPPASPVREFIYLHVFEQEVSATEDDDLREVALGGPDTTGRLRLIQRVKRLEVPASDCADALKSAVTQWGSLGYDFDPATMRLRPRARLQAGYAPPESPPNLCEPTAQGGYLGADNQLIRVQIALDPSTGTPYLLWGFDNAAFLFQVEQIGSDNKTLTLLQVPVDAYHFPAANQTVEVLKSGLKLANGRYVAEATGFVATLAQGYKGGSIQLADALAGFDLTEPVYVRIWQDRLAFTPGVPVALGSTGLLVTITPNANGTSHGGDYWMIAVRPSTPQEVYPERLLNSPQPPDGPRQWVCPLAVIDWRTWQVSDQCRNCFDHLIDLCHRDVGGCCTVSVRPEDLTGTTTLQTIINGLASTAGRMNATVCLMPGTFELSEPLRLDSRHDYLTIEACHDGAVLRARPGSEANFADGLIVLERANCVTIRGLRLEPPPVSAAGRSAGWANLLASSASAKELLRINESLHTSIAIRSVHCAVLRVEGCLFRFSLMPANPNAPLTNVFSVGVFANGPTWGLTLDGNRFIREEKYLRSTRQLFRLICGFLIAPAVQPAPRSNVGASTSASTVLPALLAGAVIRDNEFAGLTVAALVLSDCGVVRFERNRVHDCVNGYYSLSFLAVGRIFSAYQRLATANQGALLSNLDILGPATVFASAILLILLFPLPADSRRVGSVAIASGATTTIRKVTGTATRVFSVSAALQKRATTALMNRIAHLGVSPTAADAVPVAKPTEPTTQAADASPVAGSAEPATPAESEPPAQHHADEPPAKPTASDPGPAAADSGTASPTPPPTTSAAPTPEAPTSGTATTTPSIESVLKLVTKAGAPLVPLTIFEQVLMLAPEIKRGLNLCLHFNGNDITAEVSNGPSGSAVFVFDDEFKPGRAEACGNILRNRSGSPTATFFMGTGSCVVSGNTIVNTNPGVTDPAEISGGAASLHVDVSGTTGSDTTAIAGNCLGGRLVINPATRPTVPSPMNDWTNFNGLF